MMVSLSNHTRPVICDCGCASEKNRVVGNVRRFCCLNLLLMIVCLAGLATDQMMMVVSKDPLATRVELGDQATLLTRALWKPHSLL